MAVSKQIYSEGEEKRSCAGLFGIELVWNSFEGSGKMVEVLAEEKNKNTGFRKSVLQSGSMVYRSSRKDKPVITYL